MTPGKFAKAALTALLLAACSRPPAEVAAACPPAQAAPPGPEAIDRLMDAAMRDAISGRRALDPDQRREARRQVVLGCLQNVATTVPLRLALAEAAARVAKACEPAIDRYNQAEATEAAFAGDPPPEPVALGENRVAFQAQAAAFVRDIRAGRCPPVQTVAPP
jgi:hypothetical protein